MTPDMMNPGTRAGAGAREYVEADGSDGPEHREAPIDLQRRRLERRYLLRRTVAALIADLAFGGPAA